MHSNNRSESAYLYIADEVRDSENSEYGLPKFLKTTNNASFVANDH